MNENLIDGFGYRMLSNSELQTFNDCRRKWWLGWYLGLTPKYADLTGVRSTGTRIHAALAEYYKPNGTDPFAALGEVQSTDWATATTHVDTMTDLDYLERLQKDFDLESAMISGYLEWLTETGVDAGLEFIGSETYVEAVLPETDVHGVWHRPVKLIGKLDAPVRTEHGELKFIDHKSVASLLMKGLRIDPQMLHYHLLQFLSTQGADERCTGALYNMLKRSKRTARATPPFYSRVPIDHNIHELNAHRMHVAGIARDLQDVEYALDNGDSPHLVAYPRKSNDCSWKCDFFSICPLFNDGSRATDMADEHFVQRNPLDYYKVREGENESEQ